MSGGLTSYPRTGGGGGSDLVTIQTLLGQLNSTDLFRNDHNARQIIEALKRYEQSPHIAPADVVQVATDVRNALFVARVSENLIEAFFREAMTICAAAFKAWKPLPATALAPRSQNALQAIAALVAGASKTALRRHQEEIGLVALLYELSALLGQDLAATILANPVQIAPRWIEVRSGSALIYLEPGSSYNVNVMVCVEIPGSSEPLVIVGEAKGGASTYGSVKGPSSLLKDLVVDEIKQTQIEYAVSRAMYMKNDNSGEAYQDARREAGKIILKAWEDGRLAYAAARGKVDTANTQTTRLDKFDCQ
ncbi:hypothetical protein [Paraburkholderia sp. J8-2]|uniref:hypothetical protein n=1 Tax=Paraburkholderia sp. J8-2 TaxID=2805440 RepID=UPI002AB67429|nr:hypothetical protein [Paraburkholderia sp. J8-2]